MKILKTANIKEVIIEYLKTAFPTCKVEGNYHYVSIRMPDVGSIEFSFINRRKVRRKGTTDTYDTAGGGVMFGGHRDGSMLIHGGFKSDFGVFDEVEFKRRIDTRFKKKIEDAENRKKQEQIYNDKVASIDPIIVPFGFIKDVRYTWQTTWVYDNKVGVTLRNGGNLTFEVYNRDLTEAQVIGLAKITQEFLSGKLTNSNI